MENKLKVTKVSANWCGPCNMLKSTIWGKLEEKYPDVVFEEIDADKNPTLLTKLQVKTLPTVIFTKDDKEVGRVVGLQLMASYEVIIDSNK